MKMHVIDGSEISRYLNRGLKSVYDEIWDAVNDLPNGKCLVIEYDDAKRAKKLASTLSTRVLRDNKIGTGLFKDCYYSKTHNIVLIGKR